MSEYYGKKVWPGEQRTCGAGSTKAWRWNAGVRSCQSLVTSPQLPGRSMGKLQLLSCPHIPELRTAFWTGPPHALTCACVHQGSPLRGGLETEAGLCLLLPAEMPTAGPLPGRKRKKGRKWQGGNQISFSEGRFRACPHYQPRSWISRHSTN